MDKSPGAVVSGDYDAKNPQSGAPRKVGIVYHSMKDVGEDYEVELYLVNIDLHSDHNNPAPAVRFIFPSRNSFLAFCVLRSTVYIFGGYGHRPPDPEGQEKYAKRYELPVEVGTDILVKDEKLQSIPIMTHPKSLPKAVPTPDGQKILVFSEFLSPLESSRTFELFDPQDNEWEDLPVLPWDYPFFEPPAYSYSEVRSYSFICERFFFVETNLGSYALDLVRKEWSRLNVPPLPACGYFVMAKDQYAITPGTAYHLFDGGFLAPPLVGVHTVREFYSVTFAPPSWPQPFDIPPSILPLHPIIQGEGEAQDGEVCHTCVLRIETGCNDSGSGYEARLSVEVCHTNLTTLYTRVSKRVSLLRIGLTAPHSDFSLISVS
ncbi:hypothetical protein ACS0TY_023996 [Phlomoides rotata]